MQVSGSEVLSLVAGGVMAFSRASSQQSSAIPTDSVIHGQGTLTPLFILSSVFRRATLSPPINYCGINLYHSVYLLLRCLSCASLKYVNVPESVSVK